MRFILLSLILVISLCACSPLHSLLAAAAVSANKTVAESVYNSVYNSDASEKIIISFAGDCTLGTDSKFPYTNSLPHRLKQHNNDFSYFFSGVNPIFAKDDLTVVNLENVFTTSTERAAKQFCFKSDPSYAQILAQGNIDIVNIANNHIYDYGQSGLEETIGALKNMKIQYCGEGHIAYRKVNDTRIAFVGHRGFDINIKRQLAGDIKQARKNADIVVISMHWGIEKAFYPNRIQLELGRFAVDEGADIVVGHHPHVIQGIDYYKGKYIVYSLANFCFGGNFNPQDKDTFIFQCGFILKNGKVIKSEGTMIPCSISSVSYINNYKPIVLEGNEKERVLDRIYTYSQKLKYGIKRAGK